MEWSSPRELVRFGLPGGSGQKRGAASRAARAEPAWASGNHWKARRSARAGACDPAGPGHAPKFYKLV